MPSTPRSENESMMGRFEIHHFPHWSFADCLSAFNAKLSDFAEFGGSSW